MAKEFKPGEKVGKYEIIRKMNEGNFATAYEATDGSRSVFLKIYSDPTKVIPDKFEPFIKQQYYLKEVLNNIPYCENIYELFEIDDGYIHVQAKEFMTGVDLAKYLKENAPPFEKRKLIALVILYGLNEIHKAGIVHTDLKPEQIFLREDSEIKHGFQVKICDFDFSRIPGKFEPPYKVTTQFYSSPEYLRGEEIGFEADVFTMGIIIYKLLTGKEPYPGSDQAEYQKAVFEYNIVSPKDINPSISDETSELILRMLHPEKSQRPSLIEVHSSIVGKEMPIGPKKKYRIVLSEEGSDMKAYIFKPQMVNRSDLRMFVGYKYVDKEQFELFQKDSSPTGWAIKSRKEVVNPTYVGTKNISGTGEEVDLKEGDEIFIGNLAKNVGLRLKVKFEEIES